MKVLHVTDDDLRGRRFNGFDLLDDLPTRGIEGAQAVLRKFSDDPRVVSLWHGRGDEELQHRIEAVEHRNSINNLLPPWGRLLARANEFRDADVVHYHLIHNQVVSLYDLKWLFGLKPSVWTFHDPWPLTGHCVHPLDCSGWLSGCAPCPYLDRHFALVEDRADQLWRVKQRVFSGLNVDVVVASPWMLDMVRRSPLTSHLEHVHLIPFGIDARSFLADSEKRDSRRRLGVPEGDFVVLVRASSWEVKGLAHVIAALARRPPPRPTTLLTVDEKGLLRRLRRDFRVIDLGWVEDDALYALAFSACDVFLMPSLAEGFGLMAVEAMAAGRPVVSFADTAVPDITHAPECGMAVPWGDSAALRAVLDYLAGNGDDAARRGDLGRRIAADEYGHERYLDSMAALYGSVLSRQRAPAGDGPSVGDGAPGPLAAASRWDGDDPTTLRQSGLDPVV